MTYIQTFSGKKFDLLKCTPEDISIIDIAHALSQCNRFAGHTPLPYSVAQHCVIASRCAEDLMTNELGEKKTDWKRFAQSMLLHDAAEAYTGDISKHVKRHLGNAFGEIENSIMQKVAIRFDVQWPMTPGMKQIDADLLETEFHEVWGYSFEGRPKYGRRIELLSIRPIGHQAAKLLFLRRFSELGGIA